MKTIDTIFFDLGGTLGNPELTPSGRLVSFQPFAFAAGLLGKLRGEGLRLGVISNTGQESGARVDQALADAGLLTFFTSELLIYSAEVGMEKNSPLIFQFAVTRAGATDAPTRCLFVGENAAERAFAREAGMRVRDAPHDATDLFKGELAGTVAPG